MAYSKFINSVIDKQRQTTMTDEEKEQLEREKQVLEEYRSTRGERNDLTANSTAKRAESIRQQAQEEAIARGQEMINAQRARDIAGNFASQTVEDLVMPKRVSPTTTGVSASQAYRNQQTQQQREDEIQQILGNKVMTDTGRQQQLASALTGTVSQRTPAEPTNYSYKSVMDYANAVNAREVQANSAARNLVQNEAQKKERERKAEEARQNANPAVQMAYQYQERSAQNKIDEEKQEIAALQQEKNRLNDYRKAYSRATVVNNNYMPTAEEIDRRTKEIDEQIAAKTKEIESNQYALNERIRNRKLDTYNTMLYADDFKEKSAFNGSDNEEANRVNGWKPTEYDPLNTLYNDYFGQIGKDERQIYNYLLNTNGQAAASEFLALLKPELDKRATYASQQKAYELGKTAPLLTTAASIITSPIRAAGALGSIYDKVVNNTVNPYALYNRPSAMISGQRSGMDERLREDVSKFVESIGGGETAQKIASGSASLVANGVIAGLESAWNGLLAQNMVGNFGMGFRDAQEIVTAVKNLPEAQKTAEVLSLANKAQKVIDSATQLTTIVMGAGAVSDSIRTAKERGLSDEQAFELGLIAGLTEYATEHVSIENLFNTDWTPTNLKQTILKGLQQGGFEASEEVVGDIVNGIADLIVSKDKNEWKTAIDAYKKEGLSDGKAFAKVLLEKGWDTLKSGISGFISASGPVVSEVAKAGIYNAQFKTHNDVQRFDNKNGTNLANNIEDIIRTTSGQNESQWANGLADMVNAMSPVYNGNTVNRARDYLREAVNNPATKSENAFVYAELADYLQEHRKEISDLAKNKKSGANIEVEVEKPQEAQETEQTAAPAATEETTEAPVAETITAAPALNEAQTEQTAPQTAQETVQAENAPQTEQNTAEENTAQTASTTKQDTRNGRNIFLDSLGLSEESTDADAAKAAYDQVRKNPKFSSRRKGLIQSVVQKQVDTLNDMRNSGQYTPEQIQQATDTANAIDAQLRAYVNPENTQRRINALNAAMKRAGVKANIIVDEGVGANYETGRMDRGSYREADGTIHINPYMDTQEAFYGVIAHEVFHKAADGSARRELVDDVLNARQHILDNFSADNGVGVTRYSRSLISNSTMGDYVASYSDLIENRFGLSDEGRAAIQNRMNANPGLTEAEAMQQLCDENEDAFWSWFGTDKSGGNARDYMREDVAAHFMETLGSQHGEEILRTLLRDNRTALQKFIDAVRKLLKMPERDIGDRQVYENLVNSYERLIAEESGLEAKTLKGTPNEKTVSETAIMESESGPIEQYSIETGLEPMGLEYRKGEDGQTHFYDTKGREVTNITPSMIMNSDYGTLLRTSVDHGLISESDMKAEAQFLADTFNMMLKTNDIDLIWAVNSSVGFQPVQPGARSEEQTENYNKSPVWKETETVNKNGKVKKTKVNTRINKFSALTSNSDPQYGTTIDFTTICKKTQAIIDAMSDIMKQQKRGLTQDEIVNIVYKEVAEAGEPVPCPVCYVFARWVGLGGLFDNMYNLQNKYRDVDTDVLKADIEELRQKIESFSNGKFGENKEKLYKELKKRWKELDIKRTNSEVGIGEALTPEESDEYKKLTQQIDYIDQWTWMNDVRLQDDYEEVPADILFDINAGNEFAERYPKSWKFRTTRGPAMGKAASPYEAEHLGQIITGIGSPSLVGDKKLGDPTVNKFLGTNGSLSKDANKTLDNAYANAQKQNLLNGERMQSTSDFRYEYALDYLMAFFELQSIGSKVQMYTKVPEMIPFAASMNAEVNCSLMPLGDGYGDEAYTVVDSNGNPILDKDGNPIVSYLIFSDVTGMNAEDAFRYSDMYDNVQPIMVGINNKHIRMCMADPRITFIIPYHSSGTSETRYVAMMAAVKESVTDRDDYSDFQNDIEYPTDPKEAEKMGSPVATPEQIAARSARMKILTGQAWNVKTKKDKGKTKVLSRTLNLTEEEVEAVRNSPILTQLHARFYHTDVDGNDMKVDPRYLNPDDIESGYDSDTYYENRKDPGASQGNFLSTQQAEKIMPFEFWDKTVTIDNAQQNSQEFFDYCKTLGIHPRFSGYSKKGAYKADYDFTNEEGYWKTLPDRKMFNNKNSTERPGQYHVQKAINISQFNPDYLLSDKADPNIVKKSAQNDPRKTPGIVEKSIQKINEARGETDVRQSREVGLNASDQMSEEINNRYSRETDQDTLDFLNNQDTVKVYRAMQEIDGKLYPPMAAKVEGKLVDPTELGVWYKSDERPDLVKNGKFVLNKGNGTTVPAAYNPYFHSSASPLNDQFSSAYKRPNLVVVEGVIPKSELTSGYRAEGAKNSVGETQWHSGPVASKLKGDKARRVFLSRWFKVDRVMTDAEVADIVADTLQGENVSVPSNVVTPSLLEALRERGVQIEDKTASTDNTRQSREMKELDDEYMDAVYAEDVKTEARIVREAASANGYNSPKLYHGTDAFGFTEIDSTAPGADGYSFWAASRADMSGTYTQYAKTRNISSEISDEDYDAAVDEVNEDIDDALYHFKHLIDRTFSEWYFGQGDDGLRETFNNANPEPGYGDGIYDEFESMVADAFYQYKDALGTDLDYDEWIEETDEGQALIDAVDDLEALRGKIYQLESGEMRGGIYELYANTDNMYELDANGMLWKGLHPEGLPDIGRPYKTRDVANWARNNGYDGVIFRNIHDNGKYGRTGAGDVYAFFKPQAQVKSADPVTYDDNGDVIPPSERFDPNKTDIRWSREVGAENDSRINEERDKYNLLKAQFVAETPFGDARAINKSALNEIVKRYTDTFGEYVPEEDIKKIIRGLYEIAQRPKGGSEDTAEARYKELADYAMESARKLLDASSYANVLKSTIGDENTLNSLNALYDALNLRRSDDQTGYYYIIPDMITAAGSKEAWNEIRKSMNGMRLQGFNTQAEAEKSGRKSISELFTQLSSDGGAYNSMFEDSKTATDFEKISQVATQYSLAREAFRDAYETVRTENRAENEADVMQLANDLLYAWGSKATPTVMAKAEQRVQEERDKGRERVQNARERGQQLLDEEKQKGNERLQKEKERGQKRLKEEQEKSQRRADRVRENTEKREAAMEERFDAAYERMRKQYERRQQKAEEKYDKFVEKIRQRDIRTATKALNGQIAKRLKKFNQWLEKPQKENGKHIPQKLRPVVAKVLESVLSGTGDIKLSNSKTMTADRMRQIQQEELLQTRHFVDDLVQGLHGISAADGKNSVVTEMFLARLDEMVKELNDLRDQIKPIEPGEKGNDLTTGEKALSTELRTQEEESAEAYYQYLLTIKNMLDMTMKTLRDENRMISNGKAMDLQTVMEPLKEDIIGRKSLPTATEHRKLFNMMNDRLRNMKFSGLSGDLLFKLLGDNWHDLVMHSFREGQNRQAQHEAQFADMMKELTDGYDFTNAGYNGEFVKLKKPDPETSAPYLADSEGSKNRNDDSNTFNATRAQIMQLYALWQRPDARRHLENGGACFTNERGQDFIKNTHKVTPELFEEWTSVLTDEEKEIADGIVKFLTEEASEWGNDVSKYVYGYRMYNDDHYFPMDVADYSLNRSNTNIAREPSPLNPSFSHATTKSVKPLSLTNIFDVANDHVRKMSIYNAYAAACNDLDRIVSDQDMNQLLMEKFGNGALDAIKEFIQTTGGMKLRTAEESQALNWRALANFRMNNYKRQAVSWNLSTAVKQGISIVRAANVIDPKYLATSIVTPGTQEYKEIRDKMQSMSGVAYIKSLGYSDTGFGKTIQQLYDPNALNDSGVVRGALSASKGGRNLIRAYDKFTDTGMWLAAKADEWTWVNLWNAASKEVKDQNPNASQEELDKLTTQRFNDIIGLTQVVDTALDTAPIMRSKFLQTFLPFMNEPTKSLGNLILAAEQRKKPGGGKQLAKVLTTTAIANMILEPIITTLFSMWRDEKDDSDKFWESFMEKMFGIKEDGSTNYKSIISSNFFGGLWQYPFIQGVYDAISNAMQNYDNTSIDNAAIIDTAKAAMALFDNAGKSPSERMKTQNRLWRDFIEQMAADIGIPAKTIRRQLSGTARSIMNAVGANELKWEYQKLSYNLENSNARSQKGFYDILTKTYMDGDLDTYQKMMSELNEIVSDKSTLIDEKSLRQAIEKRGAEIKPGTDIWNLDVQARFRLDQPVKGWRVENFVTGAYVQAQKAGIDESVADDVLLNMPDAYEYTDEDGEEVKMSPGDYLQYASDVGQLSYKTLSEMSSGANAKQWASLNADQKVVAIRDVYKYCKAKFKKDYNEDYDINHQGKWMTALYDEKATPAQIAKAALEQGAAYDKELKRSKKQG